MKKAILIGINESVGKETLNNAVSDVRLLAALLPHLGFNEIITLDTVETTTKEYILATLKQLNDFDSDVLLWISSHGSSLHRQFFIHCSDGGVLSEGDILKCIPSSYRNSILTAFDCCRTEVDYVPDNKRHSSIDDLNLCNLDIHYSTTYGNEAFDGKNHSPFTQAFLAAVSDSFDGGADEIFSIAAEKQDIKTEGEQKAECKMLSGRRFKLFSPLCEPKSEDLIPAPYFLSGINFSILDLKDWGDLVQNRTERCFVLQNALPSICYEALTSNDLDDFTEECKKISTLNRAIYELITNDDYPEIIDRFKEIRNQYKDNKDYYSFISAYIAYSHILSASRDRSDSRKVLQHLIKALECAKDAADTHQSTVYLLRLIYFTYEYFTERLVVKAMTYVKNRAKNHGDRVEGKHRYSIRTNASRQPVLSEAEIEEFKNLFLQAERTVKAGLQSQTKVNMAAPHHRFEQSASLRLMRNLEKVTGIAAKIIAANDEIDK